MFQFLPNSVLQMSTIFLSIIIEALPFVMLGCLISGALHVFLTPERVKKVLPKNKFLSICVGSFLGFFFPSCECGIVPIVHQFVKKDVPTHTAFAFMLTAPIINPIVLFSTYVAFSGATKFVIWRVLGSMIVAWVIGISLFNFWFFVSSNHANLYPNWCVYAIGPFKDFSDSSHASHRCHSITLFRSRCIYWFFSFEFIWHRTNCRLLSFWSNGRY